MGTGDSGTGGTYGFRSKIKTVAGTFYFSDLQNDYDWTAPQNDGLWQDGVKTLFDPCPAGWRVPRGGSGDSSIWCRFTVDNRTWTATEKVEIPGSGNHWSSPEVYGGTVWYGTHPHRPVSAVTLAPGSSAFAWTSSVTETSAFRCNMGQAVSVAQGAGRTNGLPVRCIRE